MKKTEPNKQDQAKPSIFDKLFKRSEETDSFIESDSQCVDSGTKKAEKRKRLLTKFDSVSKRCLIAVSTILIVLLIFFVIGLFSDFFRPITKILSILLTSFLLSFVLSVILQPLFNLLGKCKIKNKTARVLIIYSVIGSLLALLIIFVIIPRSASFATTIAEDLKYIFPNLQAFFLQYLKIDISNIEWLSVIKEIDAAKIIAFVQGIFGKVANVGVTIVTTLIFSFFMIKDREILLRGVGTIMPAKIKRHYINITNAYQRIFKCYIRGQFLVVTLLGLAATVVFLIVGLVFKNSCSNFLAYAILFGFIIGLTDLVPYIGPWIGASIPVGYALVVGPNIPLVVTLLICVLVLQLLENYVLQPSIQGKQLEIHALAIFVSTIVFGTLFGLVGIILAAPLAGMLKVTYSYALSQYRKNKEEEKESAPQPTTEPIILNENTGGDNTNNE